MVVAVLAVVGWTVAWLAPPADDELAAWAAGRGGRPGEIATLVLSQVSYIPGVVVALGVALVVARRRGRWRDLAYVAVAGTTELVTFLAASTMVGRSRPDVPSPDAAAFTGSFPSGHVAMTVVMLVGLATLIPTPWAGWRRAAVVAGWLAAALVAVARVVRGQHRPSEVLAGLALGAAALALVRAVAARDGWSPETGRSASALDHEKPD